MKAVSGMVILTLALLAGVIALPQAPSVVLAEAPAAPVAAPDSDAPNVPITAPTIIDKKIKPTFTPKIADGTYLQAYEATPVRDEAGTGWVIAEPRAGVIHLEPNEWLTALEEKLAQRPTAKFRLSGPVLVYQKQYYLMVRRAEIVDEATTQLTKALLTDAAAHSRPAPATRPTWASRPAPKATSRGAASRPASLPASRPASRPALANRATAADVARRLLSENPGQAVLPLLPTAPAESAQESLVPAREPLKAGPGTMIAYRLARLGGKDAQGWQMLVFESDNTLQDPPLRLLPNSQLESLEEQSQGWGAGKIFYVSGEIHRYGNHDYLLLYLVQLKRDMHEF